MQHVPDWIHPFWLKFSRNGLLDGHGLNTEVPAVQYPVLSMYSLTQENTASALVPYKEFVTTQNT